ncbi:hypothetical protein ZTR_06033 [Talaromyces verruculosus]|nr:hypothetical protein ZTR_06033 [Talaromyces verruculosus]
MDSTTECVVYLLSLSSPVQDFTTALAELPENHKPILTTKAIHWMFPPTALSVDELTTALWDMLVCFEAPFVIPSNLSKLIKLSWSISFTVPSALLASLATTQSELAATIQPRSREFDFLTDSEIRKSDTVLSVESVEVTSGLKSWIQSFTENQEEGKQQAIIMFNLLAFKDMAKYRKYQEAFMAGAGMRHGAKPLLWGEVPESSLQRSQGKGLWEMVAFVYYPSVLHFADMLSSPDYKEISHNYREGSLVDNPLLCLVNI